MKKINSFLSILLAGIMLLSSCSPLGGGKDPGDDIAPGANIEALPFPSNAFTKEHRQAVIGSIVQTGDGNAYVSGTVPAPRIRAASLSSRADGANRHLVTLEHAFGYDCYVSGYMGNSLYVIQDHGSLAWNRKGVGHKDGTILLEYGEEGYFSISSFSENKFIVGNPTDTAVTSLWDDTSSYLFGYMVYDPDTRELTPLYEENNLRFYTAGYFIDGVAQVSVKVGDEIRFGIIDAEGNYVVEPTLGMMADERIDGALIVASEAEGLSTMGYTGDNCGRNVGYDSTLMTNVQKTRHYECGSQTVGIINAQTGESILPCKYAYVERVMDTTYFVVDNEGKSFLFDAGTKEMSEVEEIYSYSNSEWMICTIVNDEEENPGGADAVYLADKELKLYETTGINLEVGMLSPAYKAKNLINTNAISSNLNEAAKNSSSDRSVTDPLRVEFDPDKRTSTVTVNATGDVIYDVNSLGGIYDGHLLYTHKNSLYRYDLESGERTRIETGYGDFTDNYEGWAAEFHTEISPLDDGVYILRYCAVLDMGQTYLMVIINDRGEVLYDSAINSVEKLTKNYLGKYDDALYELAGSTNIEDNYFLTRDDGSHFLIQFVRGEADEGDSESEEERRYTRRICNLNDIAYLSPFRLDFTDGSEISVSIRGSEISTEKYAYDSATQSLKLLTSAIDFITQEKMRTDGFAEFVVTSGDESVTLRIELSQFAFRF